MSSKPNLSRWRRYLMKMDYFHAHQHAMRKKKRVHSRISAGAVGMTPFEVWQFYAQQHALKMSLTDYDTLYHAKLIRPMEPGRYYHKKRIIFIVDNLSYGRCNKLVEEACYAAAFRDYLSTRTILGARTDPANANLGLLSAAAFLVWECLSPRASHPLKERYVWDVWMRYVAIHAKNNRSIANSTHPSRLQVTKMQKFLLPGSIKSATGNQQ